MIERNYAQLHQTVISHVNTCCAELTLKIQELARTHLQKPEPTTNGYLTLLASKESAPTRQYETTQKSLNWDLSFEDCSSKQKTPSR